MKRMSMPKTWPLPRKGTKKYIVKPKADLKKSMPLLILLRDIYKLADTRKEIKKILQTNEILVNSKRIISEDFPVHLFDVISLPKIKKFLRLDLKNKKLNLKEIAEKDAEVRTYKIIGKKILGNKKIQINLDNGDNIISDISAKVHDSLIIDLKQNKIVKHLPLKEKAEIEIIKGKHMGNKGIIEKIKKENKIVKVKINDKIIDIPFENIFIVK